MKYIFLSIFLCFQIFQSSSQIKRSIEKGKNNLCVETVNFTIPQYLIDDSMMIEEFDNLLNGFVSKDTLYCSLDIESKNEKESLYSFHILMPPEYCENSIGYFLVQGIIVLLMGNTVPHYLKKTTSVRDFSYKRYFYIVKNKKGEDCELTTLNYDDNNFDHWTSLLVNNHFVLQTDHW